ncbi:MAG: hypothetical protein RMK73_01590 [Geminicoccaceae bacterium]|nr:hypothetical protein [Geminicoccaceae bacterium]
MDRSPLGSQGRLGFSSTLRAFEKRSLWGRIVEECAAEGRLARLVLVVGPPAICADSLRAWLALQRSGLSFELAAWSAFAPTAEAARGRALPLRPPVLLVDEVTVWGPLAIGEFAAEAANELLPADPIERAICRSIAHEFANELRDLETFVPFDLGHLFGPPGKLLRGVERDLARFLELVGVCRRRWSANGPFLFGRFSLADAASAPICCALATNRIALEAEGRAYVETITGLPELARWAGLAEGLSGGAAPEGVELAEQTGLRDVSPASRSEGPWAGTSETSGFAASSGGVLKPIGAGTRRRR